MDDSTIPLPQSQRPLIPTLPIPPVVFLLGVGAAEVSRLAISLAKAANSNATSEFVPQAILWLCRAQDYLDQQEHLNIGKISISPATLLDTHLLMGGSLSDEQGYEMFCFFSKTHSLLSTAQHHLDRAALCFREEIAKLQRRDVYAKREARAIAGELALSVLEKALSKREYQKQQKELEAIALKALGLKSWVLDASGQPAPLSYQQACKVWFPKDHKDRQEELMVVYLPLVRCPGALSVTDDNMLEFRPNNELGRRERAVVRKQGISVQEITWGLREITRFRQEHRRIVNIENAKQAKGKTKKRAKSNACA